MFTIPTQVYPSSCDARGKMKLYAVMQRMQDCSELWLNSEPTFADYFRVNDMGQLLAYRQIDVVREPAYGEALSVCTSVYEVKAMFGYRNTCIYDYDGKPCYLSWGIGAFVNRQTGRLQRVPEQILNSVTVDSPVEMEYTERRIILPHEQLHFMQPIIAHKTDIDYNHHVNNAEYMRMAVNLLPDDFAVRRVRIEYKVPARLADTLQPTVLDCGDDYYVVLYLGEQVSTIFQFSK
ncbi:MAG: hypothetical protein IJS00_02975 [Paludibacteraceae bacterium]|nr:hypothetical protein [Paludibacteraceae bacterium]